ncbi:hypothetical protein E4T81_07100 [Barnesiella sp. WM24]|uniref:DUF6452 family protein n=1 Tax=Barnesiella sp. WM24 TaxID=2558278 RepID=UPI0010718D39|nr:DUF6452 family protein [Barnesiella sp. WM24]TFU93719.1 hypothetical protein E4T81_07100 [Barnesiella sp. WM24]
MGKILIYFSIVMSVVLQSCNSVGCTDNKSSIPLAGFYSYEELAAITVNNVSIGGVGAPDDSLLVNNGSVSQVYLPFRADAGQSRFFIRYEDEALNFPELFDTITFNYTPIPYFASKDCGAMFRYRIDDYSYTRHLVDSVGLLTDVMTNADVETIRVYFRTQQPDDADTPDEGQQPAE